MKPRWIDMAPDAEEKQELQFQAWLSAKNIDFINPEAEAKYKERVTLIKDAIQMQKRPRRIPVCPSAGHFPIQHAGISWQDAMYDYEKLTRAWQQYHIEQFPDMDTFVTGLA